MDSRIENIIFAVLVLLSLLLVVIAETTDFWYKGSSYQNIHQGLWRSCYMFTRTDTELCIKLDTVPVTVHVTRAALILATIGYVGALALLYLVKAKMIKNTRLPAVICFFPFGSVLIGMITYTAELLVESEYRQMKFAWSYYLGWCSLIGILVAIVFDTRERIIVDVRTAPANEP